MINNDREKQLIEAQVSIANSLQGIQKNLKILNDHNILHVSRVEEHHKTITNQLKVMTEKYWWLILILISAVLLMAGYKQISTLFIPGM